MELSVRHSSLNPGKYHVRSRLAEPSSVSAQ
jgi:hypothetical protein